jgi:hypothetical protein
LSCVCLLFLDLLTLSSSWRHVILMLTSLDSLFLLTLSSDYPSIAGQNISVRP